MRDLSDTVKRCLYRGARAEARTACERSKSPLAEVLLVGFERLGRSSKEVLAAAVTGALNTNLGDPGNIQVFAGPRDDPFFLDLEAFFCILPDRKPVGGALAGSCALSPNPSAPFYFRNPAVNYVSGYNVNAIVIELPSYMLENGAPGRLGIWGSISQ